MSIFFLGVGKYAPNNAVNGDMGLIPPLAKQWTCVVRTYFHLKNMPEERINKQVFKWMCEKSHLNCKKWNFRVEKQLNLMNLDTEDRHAINLIEERMFESFKEVLVNKVSSHQGARPSQANKLRTYNKFKFDYRAEYYVKSVLLRNNRSTIAKFGCGVAPLRIETGRFERLPVDQRLCFHCNGLVENELHAIVMRKPAFCICENKDADQLRGNRETDQRLCFRYTDSTILYFLYTKFQASSHLVCLYSLVCVGPGRKPRRPVFSQRGSNELGRCYMHPMMMSVCIKSMIAFRRHIFTMIKVIEKQ